MLHNKITPRLHWQFIQEFTKEQKQTKKLQTCLIFAGKKTKYLDDPLDFWENILWTEKTEADRLWRFEPRYVYYKTSTP